MAKSGKRRDFIEIEMTFVITVYFGKDKPEQTIERTVKDYDVIEYDSEKTEDSFKKALKLAYEKLEDKFKAILESNSVIDKIKVKKYSILSQNELLKHTQDPQYIRMRVAIPVDYKFITGIELNKPEVENQCVSEFLLKAYQKKIPTLTIDKIEEIINDSITENLDNGVSVCIMSDDETGITPEQLQKILRLL